MFFKKSVLEIRKKQKQKQKKIKKIKKNKIYAKSIESTGEEFIFSKVVGLQLFIAFD